MKLFFTITCTLLGIFCAKAQANDSIIKRLTPEKFIEAIKDSTVQVIDVRTITEYNQGHLKRAKKVDFLRPIEFQSYFENKDTLQPVYLYCRSGNRSMNAAKYLKKRGFKEIYDLRGGYSGLPDSLRIALKVEIDENSY
jgi:rhodanese-related sulfurtransferase